MQMTPTEHPTHAAPLLTIAPELIARVVELELAEPRRRESAPMQLFPRDLSGTPEEIAALEREIFSLLGHPRELAWCVGPRARQARLRVILNPALTRGEERDSFLDSPRRADYISSVTLSIAAGRFVDGTLRDNLLPRLEILEEMLDPALGYAPEIVRHGGEPLERLWLRRARAALEARGLLDAGEVGTDLAALTIPELADRADATTPPPPPVPDPSPTR